MVYRYLLALLFLLKLPVLAVPREGFADVIAPCLDAIVNISSTISQCAFPSLEMNTQDSIWGSSSSPLNHMGAPVHKATSLGSGFIIDPEGHIVTNVHVIQHALSDKGQITVRLNSGKELPVRIVGIDPRTDIALLKVKSDTPLPYLRWGDSSRARIGDWVLTVGNPFGLGGTVGCGIISNTQRSMADKIGDATHVDLWLQTDAPINNGSSGGPLIDMNSRVIGINTAIFTPSKGNVGIAFAIPERIARPIIEKLKTHGTVKRGWIGIKLGPLITPDIAKTMDLPPITGVLVDGVVPNKGAEKAGIQAGDVIVRLNDTPVTTTAQLRSLISCIRPGDILTVTVVRSSADTPDKCLTIKVTVGDLESDNALFYPQQTLPSQKSSKKILGMVLTSGKKIPERLRLQLGWEPFVENGVVILRVEGRAAQKLRSGDVILKVGTKSVSSPDDIFRTIYALKSSSAMSNKTVLLLVWRPDEGQFHHVLQISDADNAS